MKRVDGGDGKIYGDGCDKVSYLGSSNVDERIRMKMKMEIMMWYFCGLCFAMSTRHLR